MLHPEDLKRPTKEVQRAALASYNALAATLQELDTEYPELEIEETKERIKVPLQALQLLARVLKELGAGRPISLVPIATEMTTQAAAELLGCSRPHLVQLLEKGEIPFTKVGKHRRVRFEDVQAYRKVMKAKQRKLIREIMKADEKSGLYGA